MHELTGGAIWLCFLSAACDQQMGWGWITNSSDGDTTDSPRAKEMDPVRFSHLSLVKCRTRTNRSLTVDSCQQLCGATSQRDQS